MPRENLIQVRRGSRSEWLNVNPILEDGEFGFELDTGRIKIGDGSKVWSELNYVGSSENFLKIYNNTGFAIQKGQSVYINGFDSYTNLPTVSLYVSDGTIPEHKFAGLMSEYTPDGQYGFVSNFGVISGINTTGSISNISVGDEFWSNGDILYSHPSDHGKFTKNKPLKNAVIIGSITYSHNSSGSILIKSFVVPRFSQLNEIYFNDISNSDLINYNAANGLWINRNDLDGGII